MDKKKLIEAYSDLIPEYIPEKIPISGMTETLGIITLLLIIILIIVNTPIGFRSIVMARAMPDANGLIVEEGLIFKSANRPEIYLLNDKFEKQWITDRAVFEAFELDDEWRDLEIVDDRFIAQFPDGKPIYLLTKCDYSPRVYALEEGTKRWVKDFQPFDEKIFGLEQMAKKSCAEIAQIPTGPPIFMESVRK